MHADLLLESSLCNLFCNLSCAVNASQTHSKHSRLHFLIVQGLCFLSYFATFFFLHRSKSTSDIQVEIKAQRQQTYEELQRHRDSMKEVDDKWQDVSVSR